MRTSIFKIPTIAAGRSGTRQLRYDVNNLINNAASDMSVHWNKSNRAFTDRISECQDAHRNLKSNLILTKNVSSINFSNASCTYLSFERTHFAPGTISFITFGPNANYYFIHA